MFDMLLLMIFVHPLAVNSTKGCHLMSGINRSSMSCCDWLHLTDSCTHWQQIEEASKNIELKGENTKTEVPRSRLQVKSLQDYEIVQNRKHHVNLLSRIQGILLLDALCVPMQPAFFSSWGVKVEATANGSRCYLYLFNVNLMVINT